VLAVWFGKPCASFLAWLSLSFIIILGVSTLVFPELAMRPSATFIRIHSFHLTLLVASNHLKLLEPKRSG
jgi:hypothetical protein